MNDSRRYSFRELFGAGWSVFRHNYGLCLGITVIFLVVYILLAVLSTAFVVSIVFDEGSTSGIIVNGLLGLFMSSVIIFPLGAYLGFWLVQRVRKGERSQRGRYGTIVVLSFLMAVCFLPTQIAQGLGDPTGMAQLRMMPTMFKAGFDRGMAKNTLDAAKKADFDGFDRDVLQKKYDEANARFKEAEGRMQELQTEGNPGMQLLAGLLALIAMIFVYFWGPWAMKAALDPLEEAASTGQALARGRELARNGGPWNIWWVPTVFTIIMVASICACCLPFVFFGLPLAFAMAPGMYMCLRGEMDSTPAAA